MTFQADATVAEGAASTPEGSATVTKIGDVYKKVQLNLRVRRIVKERLEKHVLPLWKMVAEEKGQDAELIDLTYVCERILDGESEGELATYGIEAFPQTKDEQAALRAEIRRRIKVERDTQ